MFVTTGTEGSPTEGRGLYIFFYFTPGGLPQGYPNCKSSNTMSTRLRNCAAKPAGRTAALSLQRSSVETLRESSVLRTL